MGYKFVIEFQKNGSVKITKRNSQAQIYRMPYELLTPGKCEFEVKNPFIVYILYAHNHNGRDYVYVGKSKNGIFGRPKQHKDKFKAELCYILTQEFAGTFFNDGTIQYLEHEVNQKVNATNAFINTTENTNTGTANPSDEDDCNDYLREAYMMLKVLGLDLDKTYPAEDTDSDEGEADEKEDSIVKPALLSDDAEMKVGEYVRKNMENLFASGYLDKEKFQTLCTVEGSRFLTHRNLPLFWKIKKGEGKKNYPKNEMVRYWSDVHEYQGQYFLMFSQWYNDDNVRGNVPKKSEFIEWYKKI
jgi:hypothetical protein